MTNKHISVLLNETIQNLNIKPDGIYVDCTLGRGGHSQAILKHLSKNGKLISIDKDLDAVNFCKEMFKNEHRITIIKDDFSNIQKILTDLKIDKVDGIIADLGISSPQIDTPERGFSYRYDSMLDMRMDKDNPKSAYHVLNYYNEKDLIAIFKNYGDVKNPTKLVKLIIKKRKLKKIHTTFEFLEIIKNHINKKDWSLDKNFANNYFQAIRIEVNNEFAHILSLINSLTHILTPFGRALFITFHSLEDKLVTNKLKTICRTNIPIEVPIESISSFKLITKKPIVPSEQEIKINPRSRSARLRIVEKNWLP